jgi:exopolysaccharide production protein ExoY
MILKFRTMKVNVETRTHERHLEQLINADVLMTKLDAAGDPRIIPGGALLRATGFDELPQLFNVLRGEMSLVGPEMIKLDIFYTKNMSLWLDLTVMLKTLPALIPQVIDSRSAPRPRVRAVAGNLSNKFIAGQS